MEKSESFYAPMEHNDILKELQLIEQAIASTETANEPDKDEHLKELHARYEELQNQLNNLEKAA